MEKRLTSQGPRDRSSFTVTLPKEWVLKEKLEKSKLVDLRVVGNKVVISPGGEQLSKASINADDYNKSLIKVIPGLYRLGVDELKINLADNRLLEKITELLSDKLIGYEVIEQGRSHIIIKDIAKESEEDFKTVLRRIFLLIFELSESKGEFYIKNLDRNINKLCNYCLRILMKKSHSEFLRTPLYYLLIDQIEKLKDELTWVLNKQLTKNRLETLKEAIKLFRTAYEIFYKFNIKSFNDYSNRAFNLKNEIKLIDKIDLPGMHLHNISRIINSIYGTIFTINFQS